MDNSGYVALSRQSGLAKEMQIVANNIANMATTGYRREGVVFAETLAALPVEGGSLAMTDARVRVTDAAQGALSATGGAYDLAIEGPGFFLLETPAGERLTRAGAFARSDAGELVNLAGHRVLDEGGSAIVIPPDAKALAIAADGSISADGAPIGRIGLFDVADPGALIREDGVAFRSEAPIEPAEGRVLQGFIEKSNVNSVAEIARMIEVQRGYELGQKFLEREDERIRSAVRLLGQAT